LTFKNRKQNSNNAEPAVVSVEASFRKFVTNVLGSDPLDNSKGNAINPRHKAVVRDDIIKFCEGLPEDMYAVCTSLADLKESAKKQVVLIS